MAHSEFGYANHKRIPNGTKVTYKMFNGSLVKGVIVDQGKPMFPRFQNMRVTSRNHSVYKTGEIIEVSTNYVTIRK